MLKTIMEFVSFASCIGVLLLILVATGGCATQPPPRLAGETDAQYAYRAQQMYIEQERSRQAAGRALQSAGQSMQQLSRPPAHMQGPTQTTCRQYGRQVNCTTW